MKASSRVTFLAGLMLLLSIVGTVLTLRCVDQNRNAATLKEVLYISSPKAIKRLSLGYSGLLADIYWTRAVQYFGGKHSRGAANYELLAPLLEITTKLDPHLLVAYEFGANFLAAAPPNGAGKPDKAVELITQGIKDNPDVWRLYYELGFVYYMELKQYSKAADAFAQGSEVPGAHPFLKILAANMAQHAGDVKMARMMWTTTFESTKDRSIRANAAAHLRALQVDDEVGALEAMVARYQLATGTVPADFSEFVKIGELRGIPLDPLGSPYHLTSDGRVEVQDPDKFPYIQMGKPLGYVPSTPKFLPTD